MHMLANGYRKTADRKTAKANREKRSIFAPSFDFINTIEKKRKFPWKKHKGFKIGRSSISSDKRSHHRKSNCGR